MFVNVIKNVTISGDSTLAPGRGHLEIVDRPFKFSRLQIVARPQIYPYFDTLWSIDSQKN